MALNVIGAGFGRTGTLSMKAALERLGYVKCHHMLEVFGSDRQLKAWDDIGLGSNPGWDYVFENYEASVDFPSASYWKELVAHYPEAKVILTTRTPESWYKSASDTIYALTTSIPGWMKTIPKVSRIGRMVQNTVWQRMFDGRFEDREYAMEVFARHEEEVKASIPADRLLVFHPKEGWEPLCTFLGKPVPDEPFPNVNDTAEFRSRVRMMKVMQFVPVLAGAVILAGIAYAVSLFQ